MKNSLKIAISFLLAFVLLYDTLDFSILKTIVVSICILSLLILKFGFKIDAKYYVYFIITAVITLVYSFINDIYSGRISFIIANADIYFYIGCILYILTPIIYSLFLTWYIERQSCASQENFNIPNLYPERERFKTFI